MSVLSVDVLVRGGGLAGMTAALSLAKSGRSVLLSERLPRLGGRCGQFSLDGHSFTIGCNDFGARIVRDLEDLGAPVSFLPSTNTVDFGETTYRLPPRPLAALRMLKHVPSVLRLVRRVRAGSGRTLGELYPEGSREDFGYRLVSLLAYALGSPPSLLRAEDLLSDFSSEYSYGHQQMVVPVGGPQAITDTMAGRLQALGAVIWTSSVLSSPVRDGGKFIAAEPRGEVQAKAVIDMHAPPPSPALEGLSVAQLLWEARPDVPFVDTRALISSPPSPEGWLMSLHQGQRPKHYGWHIFRDVTTASSATFTGYALMPRGREHLDDNEREELLTRVEEGVERHAPGFRASLRYRRALSPSEYRARHGFGCALSVSLPGPRDRPMPTEIEPGRYRMGNGAGPPGEHTNAAMLSGLWAAEQAGRYLSSLGSAAHDRPG